MKSTLLLITTILISTVGIAQVNQTALTKGADALIKSKTTKEYSFTFPDNITAEIVEKKAHANEFYFTINYNKETHLAIIKLTSKVKLTEAGLVMIRYLMSIGIKNLKVDEKTIDLKTFNKEYLRK